MGRYCRPVGSHYGLFFTVDFTPSRNLVRTFEKAVTVEEVFQGPCRYSWAQSASSSSSSTSSSRSTGTSNNSGSSSGS
jgi:hypothetical protein